MSNEGTSEEDRAPDDRRRRLLGYAAVAALGGTGAAGAWFASRPEGTAAPSPIPTATSTDTPTRTDAPMAEPVDEVPATVERFAPDLYFGALEKWYPTDPREYVVETEDGPVVDGFAALDEYSAAFAETGTPPAPVVFYNVVEAADGVDAIQYWMYSVFDQFTVNFHWHDWELLQVFVDRESDSPLLLSASAHSRKVPNNEFLDPALSADRRPGVLAEVGSHSSGSDLNDAIPSFERLTAGSLHSDVTNDVLHVAEGVTAPFAYGLPRDEGARLPFVMPELDGRRLDEHSALSVEREDFVDERVTVESWRGLPRPPEDLPLREPGLVMVHPDSSMDADATYDLTPIEAVSDTVDGFEGPQLSFEFAVPGFVEDRIAGHITSVGIPWEQERFTDPLADVTDPEHRRRIDGSAPPGLADRVVGRVLYLRSGADGALGRVTDEARDALASAISVSLYSLPVELAVRLASDAPTATVTRAGIFGYLHVEAGEHLLVVNGPGVAPVAERFVHEGGLFRAGADGDLTVVAADDAGWIRGDGRGASGIERVRVVEDYAGVVYDGRPAEADRFAVAVHRDGRYTVEITDSAGRPGAFRVGPDDFGDDGSVLREVVETGKGALARTFRGELEALLELTRSFEAEADSAREVERRISTALEATDDAITAIERGDAGSANEWLSSAASSLERALELLSSDAQAGYSDAEVAALAPRLRAAIERAGAAIETELA